eukprot:CAMPEP_0180135946 /NCGR_PEP_ID=MMETSP0986-20121125/11168_1 /TAXON_ID=697907 /ORGANISM="non described non described, Strain CCMP2293" /LENGTH=32 /DNA_ID= /DNA_START= /DNA_END= /DNA_ORIENTATION=
MTLTSKLACGGGFLSAGCAIAALARLSSPFPQ